MPCNRITPIPTPLHFALLALAISLSPFATAQISAPATAPAAVPPMPGIAHIAVRVKDIAASVAFYHKLGFDQAFANMAKDGTTVTQSFVKLNDRQFIELYPVTDRDNKVEFLHLCFEGADLNAIHDHYVAEGLTPISVRTAGAGNLLFTMKGPQQFADPQNIEYTQYMPGSKHTLDFGQHLGPDRVGDKMTVVALAMQDPAAARTYYLHSSSASPLIPPTPHASIFPVARPANKSKSFLWTHSAPAPASSLPVRRPRRSSSPTQHAQQARISRQSRCQHHRRQRQDSHLTEMICVHHRPRRQHHPPPVRQVNRASSSQRRTILVRR